MGQAQQTQQDSRPHRSPTPSEGAGECFACGQRGSQRDSQTAMAQDSWPGGHGLLRRPPEAPAGSSCSCFCSGTQPPWQKGTAPARLGGAPRWRAQEGEPSTVTPATRMSRCHGASPTCCLSRRTRCSRRRCCCCAGLGLSVPQAGQRAAGTARHDTEGRLPGKGDVAWRVYLQGCGGLCDLRRPMRGPFHLGPDQRAHGRSRRCATLFHPPQQQLPLAPCRPGFVPDTAL